MKLKIISDGTGAGTRVIDLETEKPLEAVTRIELIITPDGFLRTDIQIIGVQSDIILQGANIVQADIILQGANIFEIMEHLKTNNKASLTLIKKENDD